MLCFGDGDKQIYTGIPRTRLQTLFIYAKLRHAKPLGGDESLKIADLGVVPPLSAPSDLEVVTRLRRECHVRRLRPLTPADGLLTSADGPMTAG